MDFFGRLKASIEYNTLAEIIKGKPYEEVHSFFKERITNELKDEGFDLNFGSLCCTIVNNGGKAVLNGTIEVYNKEGIMIGQLTSFRKFESK